MNVDTTCVLSTNLVLSMTLVKNKLSPIRLSNLEDVFKLVNSWLIYFLSSKDHILCIQSFHYQNRLSYIHVCQCQSMLILCKRTCQLYYYTLVRFYLGARQHECTNMYISYSLLRVNHTCIYIDIDRVSVWLPMFRHF